MIAHNISIFKYNFAFLTKVHWCQKYFGKPAAADAPNFHQTAGYEGVEYV